mmetsp:Transcript_10541/g.14648  ORF Transcript_10541/g.14648 Transcript_10541/m.14648 type:complete len:158 (+) Transcript_10541:201-674(+)
MVEALPWPDQYKFVEDFAGDIHKHIFYLVQGESQYGKLCRDSKFSKMPPRNEVSSDTMIVPAFPLQKLGQSLRFFDVPKLAKVALSETNLFEGEESVRSAFLRVKEKEPTASWNKFCKSIETVLSSICERGLGLQSSEHSFNLKRSPKLHKLPCRSA